MANETSAEVRVTDKTPSAVSNTHDGSFIDLLPLPAYIKSTDNILIKCNQAFVRLLKAGEITYFLNKSLSELPQSLHSEVDAYYDNCLISERIPVNYEGIFIDSTGEEHLISINKSLLNLGSEEFILGIVTKDITAACDGPNLTSYESFITLFNDRTLELEESNDALQHQVKELHRAWAELGATEQRVETALTALKAGAWEWHPKTNRLQWSKKCFEIFGLPETPEISSETWLSTVYPVDLERVTLMWERIPGQDGWFEFEFRILNKNRLKWVRKSGRYLTDEGGVEKILGVMIDITEEKFFHDRLFDRQEFLKSVIDDQTEIICRIKPSGKFSFFNQAFSRFFKVAPSDLVTVSFNSLFKPLDHAKIRRLLNLVKPGNPVLNFEQSIEKADGEQANIQWTIRGIFDAGNVPMEYQLVGRDITDIENWRHALLKSEEMFRLITENSTDIIVLLSKSGHLEYVSPSVLNILGYTPSEMMSIDPFKLVYPGDYDKSSLVETHFKTSQEALCMEFRLLNISNQVIWFETIIQPQYNQEKIATGNFIIVSRDINTRKQIEYQRSLTEKELQEANNTKDKFFSIIAHDLRSPFTAILGFSHLLDEEYDDFDDEERKLMIKQVVMATENTYQLLDNLLIWAKTQLKHTKFFPETFPIMSLIRETFTSNWSQAQAKEVDFLIRSEDDFNVVADINSIKTVLRNLFSNAIKYSYNKSTIEVDVKASKDKVSIVVTDHGTGMDSETLNSLFSLEKKVTSIKGTANEKGTGLGLILAKEFIEKNNGSLSIISEPGRGSQFCFTVPRAT